MTTSDQLIEKLRRALPLPVHGRPALAASLRGRFSGANVATRFMVTDIFCAAGAPEPMCRIDLQGPTGQRTVLVAPITHLSFGRAHPIARDIAAYRERRADAASRRLRA